MPYCPQCRVEYRLGFSECADCRVPLVSTMPPSPATMDDESPNESEYVPVLDTTDNFALSAAIGLLNEAEIPHVVDDEPSGVSPEVLAAKHQWWILPCRILVAPEYEEEARELLEAFTSPEIPE